MRRPKTQWSAAARRARACPSARSTRTPASATPAAPSPARRKPARPRGSLFRQGAAARRGITGGRRAREPGLRSPGEGAAATRVARARRLRARRTRARGDGDAPARPRKSTPLTARRCSRRADAKVHRAPTRKAREPGIVRAARPPEASPSRSAGARRRPNALPAPRPRKRRPPRRRRGGSPARSARWLRPVARDRKGAAPLSPHKPTAAEHRAADARSRAFSPRELAAQIQERSRAGATPSRRHTRTSAPPAGPRRPHSKDAQVACRRRASPQPRRTRRRPVRRRHARAPSLRHAERDAPAARSGKEARHTRRGRAAARAGRADAQASTRRRE